jgi:hypothetical protein
MAIFNSYVKLPEGSWIEIWPLVLSRLVGRWISNFWLQKPKATPGKRNHLILNIVIFHCYSDPGYENSLHCSSPGLFGFSTKLPLIMPSFTTALKSLRNRTHQERKFLHTFPQTTHCGLSAGYVWDSGWRRKKYEKLHPNTFVQERRCFGNPKIQVFVFPIKQWLFDWAGQSVNPQGSMAFHGIPLRPGAVGQIRPVRPRPFPPRKSGRPPVSRDPLQKVSRPRLRFRKIPWIIIQLRMCFRNFTYHHPEVARI